MTQPNIQLQKEISSVLESFQRTTLEKVPEEVHKECSKLGEKDVSKFVTCMLKRTKQVDKELRAFDFKLVWMNNNFNSCEATASGNKDKLKVCIDIAKGNVERYIADFKNTIKL